MALESRVSGIDTRVTLLERSTAEIAVGLANVHGDLRLNAQETKHVREAVNEIKSDTGEMLATYRAAPRMQANTRFWLGFIGGILAIATSVSALYVAFFK